MEVYVLFQSEQPITGTNKGSPVGVVSDPALANSFYYGDTEHRDFIMFNLDEIPQHTGIPGTPPSEPEKSTVDSPDYSNIQRSIDEATRKALETNQQMDTLLNKLKKRKKK